MFSWLAGKSAKPLTLGQAGELLAQAEYKKRGYEVVAANFFNRQGLRLGEIDFIAKNGQELVFVEVKTRTHNLGKFGSGGEAVNRPKQLKILKAVKVFLQHQPALAELRPRIDVCVVELERLDKAPKSVIIITNAVEDWN